MQPPPLDLYQKNFTENLLSKELITEASAKFLSHITPMFSEDDKGQESADRFTIYRNNVILSLSTAIGDSFPIVKRLIGDECFKSAAIEYVRQYPPVNSSLLFYGEGFIDFIASHPSCKTLLYLGDIARLEWFYIEAFHAGDCPPLLVEELQNISPDDINNVCFNFHPSVRLLQSQWPIDSIWEENLKENVEPLDLDCLPASDLLIYRLDLQVKVVWLTTDCFNFLTALRESNNIAQAWSLTVDQQSPDIQQKLDDRDLGGMLGYLIGLSLFTSVSIVKTP